MISNISLVTVYCLDQDQARDFYVRQLRDWKFSVDVASMVPRGLRLYGELCGLTLARAHARSGDEIALAAYLGNSDVFENAIADTVGTPIFIADVSTADLPCVPVPSTALFSDTQRT